MIFPTNELLDRAKEKTGSDYQTAKRLEVTPQRISDWRKGRQRIPHGEVVLLAQIAGLEPEAWAARIICSHYEGDKLQRIESALKKSLGAIGAVLIAFGYPGGIEHFIRCILGTQYAPAWQSGKTPYLLQ